MKMVKNIAIVAFASCFMFAGIGFHMGNNYSGLDSGTSVDTSWGATFDLNDNTTVGYDSELGMIFAFDAPAGVSLRLGFDSTSGGFDTEGTSIGMGFTWWSGGSAVKTSISTAYDMCMPTDPANTAGAAGATVGTSNTLSLTVGFGF